MRPGRFPTSRFTTREAPHKQRDLESRSVDVTNLSCAWLEVSHKQIYDQRGSPQISSWNPRGSPRGLPLGFQTEIHFKPRASPQQNYDQGISPQAELRPWRFPTSRITTREPTHKQNYDQGAGWLAGSGWLAEAEIGGVGMEQACHASGWKLPTSKLTTREALHRFLYGTQEEAPADYY